MISAFGRMTVLVDDFDAALEFYGDLLGFVVPTMANSRTEHVSTQDVEE